MYKLDNVT